MTMTMNTATLSTIEINGVTYVPAGAGGVNTLPSGNRNVVVIDRGFIFAGDLSFDEATQDYTLANAVWVLGGTLLDLMVSSVIQSLVRLPSKKWTML